MECKTEIMSGTKGKLFWYILLSLTTLSWNLVTFSLESASQCIRGLVACAEENGANQQLLASDFVMIVTHIKQTNA